MPRLSERDEIIEIIARLARIRRLIGELESECGRSANLQRRFEELRRQIDATWKPDQPRKA